MSILEEVAESPYLFLFGCVLGYTIYGAIWRLYFSPLAKFPGPKFAALTLWYEVYYDLFLNGQYTFKIERLHKQYGPILRISPFELHVSDGEFYDDLYASVATGQKRDKYAWWTTAFGMDASTFATPEHDHHRIRRSALNPFFSMQSVRRLQPLIQERVDTLMRRLQGFRNTEEVMNVSFAFAALTNDIVMQFSFARMDNRLEAEDFDPSYRDASFFGSTAGNYMRHVPWVNALSQALPDWFVEKFHPSLAAFIAQKRNTAQQIAAITSGTAMPTDHSTIFHEILDSKFLSPSEKTVSRLSDDAQVIMMAGTLTTAWVLEVSTFHLLRTPEVLGRLKTELHAAVPDPNAPIHLPTLESLPYFNAVIKETFRLTYGVSGRLARISPDEAMIFEDTENHKTWSIPPGTPVGMSAYMVHHDERFFPDSRKFLPSRWLTADGKMHSRLDKYLINFTRGSRQCAGINLAHAELYLTMFQIWWRYGSKAGVLEDGSSYEGVRFDGDEGVMELFDTSIRDVEIEADSFLPLVQPGSVGIRVRISKR